MSAEADPGPGAGPLETSLLFEVFALNQAVGRLLAEAMADGPLTPAEYAVYSAIFELESGTPTALAARLGMRLTTFMDQLRLVEARGHARRVPNPVDRRSYRVVLTAKGRAAHRVANRLFEGVHRAFVEALGEEERPRGLLRAMRAAADRARAHRAAGLGASRRPSSAPAG
jgi:DNA-binding MarR family transcriptional regulator